jgi:hypothetical protein
MQPANHVMPANAGIQGRERGAIKRHLSGRELWIPAFAGMTHFRMETDMNSPWELPPDESNEEGA